MHIPFGKRSSCYALCVRGYRPHLCSSQHGFHPQLERRPIDYILAPSSPQFLTSPTVSMLVLGLVGLRDTCLIAFMLCTGLRESELCALDVADLRQHLGETLALHIREGKGAKARLVPYGDLDFVLAVADVWLRAAGIQDGAVFRGFRKGNKGLRTGRLTGRAAQDVLRR